MLARLEDVLGESKEDAKLTAELKRVMMEQMKCKYDNDAAQKTLCKATMLDPRYKGDHIQPLALNVTEKEQVAEMVAAVTSVSLTPGVQWVCVPTRTAALHVCSVLPCVADTNSALVTYHKEATFGPFRLCFTR